MTEKFKLTRSQALKRITWGPIAAGGGMLAADLNFYVEKIYPINIGISLILALGGLGSAVIALVVGSVAVAKSPVEPERRWFAKTRLQVLLLTLLSPLAIVIAVWLIYVLGPWLHSMGLNDNFY